MKLWPTAVELKSDAVDLEPLQIEHAPEMVEVLASPTIYTHIGGSAPTLAELTNRYARQTSGHSEDLQEGWLNWIVREKSSGEAAGFVQATLTRDAAGLCADLAWVIAPEHQGHGLATAAAKTMCDWLRSQGVSQIGANIHPANLTSNAVARHLGMRVTGSWVDGEARWQSADTIPEITMQQQRGPT